jgi:ABC-type transport system involved in cytochrome c biogenesis permease subunit
MLALAKICEALLPLAYMATLGLYALAFFRRDDVFERWTRPALLGALGIHTVLIWARTVHHGHCLVYTPFEMMTLISFTITLTYLVVELSTGERGTGVFFVGMSLLFQTASAMFGPGVEVYTANPVLLNNIVGVHISAALIGYTAFTISAVYGALYLMLFHQIRSNRFNTFYERLPSLGLLEIMSARAAAIGVLFLSIAIIVAVVWMPDIVPTFSYGDPKMIATLAIWGVYVASLLARHVARLDARKVMVMSLVGFLGTIISMTIVNFLATGFHRFG